MSSRNGSPGPVELLLERLEGVRRHDGFYRAFCPAHDRKTPNLDVREGDDGRALVICRAGCETEEVVEALGLTMRDLFVRNGHPGRGDGEGLSSRNDAILYFRVAPLLLRPTACVTVTRPPPMMMVSYSARRGLV